MQILDVPVALLANILQYVPLHERLGVCTRVCRSFHAAAVEATNNISIVSTQERCDDVVQWLQRHGSGVTALKAQRSRHELTPFLASLPCPLLMDFEGEGLSLQPGFFTACTGLTRLLLAGCWVQDSPNATSSVGAGSPLMQLSVLTSLQHLGLSSVSGGSSVTNLRGTELALPSSLLSHLVQLTYLQLSFVGSDAPLQHLSALTALQHLDLCFRKFGQLHATADVLTGLQFLQDLTALKLHSAPWPIDVHSMPALTALTALRVLQLLHSTSTNPAVLAGFRQLQQLELTGQNPWDAEGSAALLAAIGQQPQLTRLRLHPCRVWSAPSAAAFSALTASSHLQHLELLQCDFPVGAWQHMFPPNKCLPELRHLCLRGDQYAVGAQQLSPADVQARASCCPALVSLGLGRQFPVSTAAPFGALTALTSLWLHSSFQDNAPMLAQLTGLQQLFLSEKTPGEQVTVSGLLQLTVLQQLQQLSVQGAFGDSGLATPAAAPQSTYLWIETKVGISAVALGRLLACLSCPVCKALRHCC